MVLCYRVKFALPSGLWHRAVLWLDTSVGGTYFCMFWDERLSYAVMFHRNLVFTYQILRYHHCRYAIRVASIYRTCPSFTAFPRLRALADE